MALHVEKPVRAEDRLQDGASLAAAYERVRRCTEALCEPLATEDYVIQSMPDASPVKWHLAHTSWFFETFVLLPNVVRYRPFHLEFGSLFNSYYNSVGARWPRTQRGLLPRPTVADVYRYRAHVDESMHALLQTERSGQLPAPAGTIVLGLNHEQQHQELILTDLKHVLAGNPLRPVYREMAPEQGDSPGLGWVAFPGGIVEIGHEGCSFAFDNESPRHKVYLQAFRLANRLVTNAEFIAFIDDKGYERPELWLSEGWAVRQTKEWSAPLYWEKAEGEWQVMTLGGVKPVHPREPVCHLSFYEADAFARWAGARLPTEAEWEHAVGPAKLAGHFLEGGRFHPAAAAAEDDDGPILKMFGDVWQWTASPYVGYPGYRPMEGALGEYNGKFMCNQLVLRGASCATPRSHARRTYRNFFPPDARWQFAGIRLAQDS